MKYIHKLLMGTFFIATFGFGQSTFTAHIISTSANGASSVYAADVDSDGDMDVLSASTGYHPNYNGEIAWYEQDGCNADDGIDGVELWGECYSIENTDSLDLHNNGLTGEIPPELWNLTNLTYLNLAYNQLTGEIPSEIGNLTNLTNLSLQNNQLIGEIPESICDLNINWSNDDLFNISNNQLCPPYPSCIENYMGEQDPFCWNCYADDETTGIELWGICYSIENTTVLDLDGNQLTGEIPSEIGNLTNLERLYLYGNQLTGEIPPEIGNLTNLQILLLSSNQLTGEIPSEIGNLTNLYTLDLMNNELSGEIPPEIGNLTYLNIMVLKNNQLTGSIPSEIGNLTNLRILWLQNNQLTGTIPSEIGNLTNLEQFYLQNNQLSGEIPGSICGFPMDYSNNYSFDISNNQLCPRYPPCIVDYIGEQDISECEWEKIVWHVATTGSDDMGDGSEQNPFATIQTGIDAAFRLGDTVLVDTGTYIENINFNGKEILVGSFYLTTNDTSYISSTIIDGNQNGSVVKFENSENSSTILSGFTIKNGLSYEGGGIYIYEANPILSFLKIINNNANHGGGGVYIRQSSSLITNTIISNNSAFWGGGLEVYGITESNNSPNFSNLRITQNISDDYGGGIKIQNSDPSITNSVILGNSSNQNLGGAISISSGSPLLTNLTVVDNSGSGIYVFDAVENTTTAPILKNLILFGNSESSFSNEIYVYSGSLISASYSLIEGGYEGEGIIDVDPLFCNPDSGDYTLAENSPCMGTGEGGANMGAFGVGCGPYNFSPTNFSLSAPSNNAQITIDDSNMNDGFITFSWDESSDENGDSLVYLLHATSTEIEDFSLDTNTTSIDIPYMELVDEMSVNNITSATIEWTVDVTDGIDTVTADNAPFTLNVDGSDALGALAEQLIPQVFALHQNYPNPFNPTTTLRYDLPEDALVNITIYDMMGRVVKTMVNSQQNAGFKSVRWNATNDKGSPVSAGLYLYTIQAGDFRQTKKMVLLK